MKIMFSIIPWVVLNEKEAALNRKFLRRLQLLLGGIDGRNVLRLHHGLELR